MRALAAAIALSLMTILALGSSPEVEAALKVFETVDSDANRMKTFCELMRIDEQNAQKADPFLEAKMDKLLDELGADFKAAWDFAETPTFIAPRSPVAKSVVNSLPSPVPLPVLACLDW